MPLDSAEFIAELSISDPPGTDPLNQGDDHIRTTKKAVQQSFPNVGSAVPQTGAQMAQMAIKNEANTFTLSNTFTNQLGVILDSGGTAQLSIDKTAVRQWQLSYSGTSNNLDFRRFVGGVLVDAPMELNQATGKMLLAQGLLNANGSAAAPSYAFGTDTGTGMYRDTSSRISFASAGVFKALIDSTQVQAVVPFIGPFGSAAAPSFSFAGRTQTGLYSLSATAMAFAVAGSTRMIISTTDQSMSGPMRGPDGSDAAPAYSFTSDVGTGIWASATSLNIAANGVPIASFTSSSDIFAAVGRSWAGNSLQTEARPAFNFNSDSDTGFYNNAPNSIGWATQGISRGTMDSAAIWTANGVSIHGDAAGSIANPSYAFTNDTDSGMYRVQANVLGWSCGNVEVMTLGTGGLGIRAGTPCFLNLPTTPGFGGSLWNDAGTVKVA